MHTVRQERPRGEDGITLVETVMTMLLLGVVGAIMLSAVVTSNRLMVRTRDETTGLADVRTVTERLGRDVRDARAVTCDGGLADPSDPSSTDPTCQAHLQVWVDGNSDYIPQNSEYVTWRLRALPSGQQYEVQRVEGNGLGGNVPVVTRQASSLLVRIAFSYDATPTASHLSSPSQQVKIQMKYDAEVGVGTDYRYVSIDARLRNKGAR